MRSREEYEAVIGLVQFGLNDCQVSRLTGIPRGTVRRWRRELRGPGSTQRAESRRCFRCSEYEFSEAAYAYLLGLYLGDGHLVHMKRGVYSLRITLDSKYRMIIAQCAEAIRAMRRKTPIAVSFRRLEGCEEVTAYWKHWPCLFPQHGPGRKDERVIELEPWQGEIIDREPHALLRGLIHSDGCRDLNWVKNKSYPRYSFTNNSADIQGIFCRACERVGVSWTRPYWKTIAVSRRSDVGFLDTFIGPKA